MSDMRRTEMSELFSVLIVLGYTALAVAGGWITGRIYTVSSLKRDLLKAAAKDEHYTMTFNDTKMSIKVEEVE